MDLAAYIRENSLMPESVLTEAVNNYLIKKFTLFEELYKNGDKYGITEAKLLQWTLAAGGPGYEILDSTKGFTTNSSDYDKLGGVEKCMNMQIMCVRRRRSLICIVTKRPDDPGLIVLLNKSIGAGNYTFGICSQFIWQSIYQLDVEPLFIEARARKLSEASVQTRAVNEQVQQSEARQIYNHILQLGITRGASDIHILPCDFDCQVLYRIDGMNYKLMHVPKNISERLANLLAVDAQIANKNADSPQDGKIAYLPMGARTEKEKRDLRFSILPTRRGRDINIRFLNNTLYTFKGLGMTEENVEAYKKILQMPQGLIMQVGPTGSGKSTTLYAGLNFIHDNSLRNIITVEDPVEVLMEGITQVDTKDEAGLTFARVSRQFLRHDVDVGVIGEIRDEETALEAVRAATTGHLVISSLHTNDSIGVLERLIRLGVDPYTLSEVLVAVMGQRLVRRLCPACKEKYHVDADDPLLKEMGIEDSPNGLDLYRPIGCEHCNNLGYKGRIAVNEILLVDRELRDMIQRHETRKTMEAYLQKIGFRSLFVDARDKVVSGITSVDELRPMMSDTLAYK